MPPWELNGWLQYGDGQFMYFQTRVGTRLLGVSGTFPAIAVVTSDYGIVCGWSLVMVVEEEIIFPRFIVKLLTALERLGPSRPFTWAEDIPGQMRHLCGNISHFLKCPRVVAVCPCVS